MPTTPFGTLLVVCLFVVVCTVTKGLFRIWNGIVVSRLGCQIGYDLRMQFYSKVLRLDMANFTEAGRGDLMNRCTTDLNSISQGVQRLFGQALLEPLKIAVCFGALFSWISIGFWTAMFGFFFRAAPGARKTPTSTPSG